LNISDDILVSDTGFFPRGRRCLFSHTGGAEYTVSMNVTFDRVHITLPLREDTKTGRFQVYISSGFMSIQNQFIKI